MHKCVFIIFYRAVALERKLRRLCDAFDAHLYAIPSFDNVREVCACPFSWPGKSARNVRRPPLSPDSHGDGARAWLSAVRVVQVKAEAGQLRRRIDEVGALLQQNRQMSELALEHMSSVLDKWQKGVRREKAMCVAGAAPCC